MPIRFWAGKGCNGGSYRINLVQRTTTCGYFSTLQGMAQAKTFRDHLKQGAAFKDFRLNQTSCFNFNRKLISGVRFSA